jgi:hypothetical protein
MIGAKKLMKTLSPAQSAILYLVSSGKDVAISKIYYKLHTIKREHREQQQLIGATISRLNKRLVALGYRIAPGEKRKTYRLRKIEE